MVEAISKANLAYLVSSDLPHRYCCGISCSTNADATPHRTAGTSQARNSNLSSTTTKSKAVVGLVIAEVTSGNGSENELKRISGTADK